VEGNATKDDTCPEIEGISIQQNVENVTQMSHFDNDATLCARVSAVNRGTIHPSGDIEDLKSYLSRPFLFRTGTYTVSPGVQDQITLSAQNDMISCFGQASYNRMEGAKGFRATLCFKLVVTSTPFHQGISCLSFQYGIASGFNGKRGNFPYLSTNLPHVKCDVSEQTSVELRVPYICPNEYFPVNTTAQDGFNNNFGVFTHGRLTNFRLAASQLACRYSIYTWFEDVELIGAYPFATTSVLLQAGNSREQSANGLISRGLEATSTLATSLMAIPRLKPVMGPTAWFTRMAARLASSFGYSKPIDQTIVKRKAIVGYMGESHVDMPSSAFVASPFQTNDLVVGTVGGTEEDEMSFDSILTKPAMIYRKEFTTTAAVGDLLYASIVSPSCFWFRTAGSGNISISPNATLTTSCFAPSHLMYIGSNFRYWRGGFKYVFQFSKSKMHGGRVVISYVPGTTQSNNSPITNVQDLPIATASGVQMTGYTKMFDLRDSSTVEFEVPFIHESPYVSMNGSIGTLTVQVVSPLNAPTNAATTIDMLVYVQALPGFEFAALCPSMIDATDFRSDNTSSGVFLQAGGVSSDADASQLTIGERFASVKQIAMIPDWHVFDQTNNTFLNFTLGPWFRRDYLPIITGTSPIANTASAVFYGSKCGRMQELFAFVYGSTEWIAITDDPDGSSNGITVSVAPTDGNFAETGAGSLYNKNLTDTSGHLIVEQRGAVRVVVPPFARYQRIPHYPYRQGAGATQATAPGTYSTSLTYSIHLYNMRIRNNTGATRRVALGRAAADNATMGQYIGPPLCNYFQSTASVPPNPSTLPF